MLAIEVLDLMKYEKGVYYPDGVVRINGRIVECVKRNPGVLVVYYPKDEGYVVLFNKEEITYERQ
jgi:hypothetical protein